MIGTVDPLREPTQGALGQPDGTTRFCLWAPQHERVELALWEKETKSTHALSAVTMATSLGT